MRCTRYRHISHISVCSKIRHFCACCSIRHLHPQIRRFRCNETSIRKKQYATILVSLSDTIRYGSRRSTIVCYFCCFSTLFGRFVIFEKYYRFEENFRNVYDATFTIRIGCENDETGRLQQSRIDTGTIPVPVWDCMLIPGSTKWHPTFSCASRHLQNQVVDTSLQGRRQGVCAGKCSQVAACQSRSLLRYFVIFRFVVSKILVLPAHKALSS